MGKRAAGEKIADDLIRKSDGSFLTFYRALTEASEKPNGNRVNVTRVEKIIEKIKQE